MNVNILLPSSQVNAKHIQKADQVFHFFWFSSQKFHAPTNVAIKFFLRLKILNKSLAKYSPSLC